MIFFNKKLGALSLFFNKTTASGFIQLLERLKNNECIEIVISEQSTEKISTLKMNLSFCDDDYIYSHKKKIILWFSQEAVEYANYKLNNFLETGDFYPAEFCNFTLTDTRMTPKGNRAKKVPILFLNY